MQAEFEMEFEAESGAEFTLLATAFKSADEKDFGAYKLRVVITNNQDNIVYRRTLDETFNESVISVPFVPTGKIDELLEELTNDFADNN
jgi:hypothetical protein